jgi:acyl-CoA reductase-like NAD-dependent aldehyde dehydrogenase
VAVALKQRTLTGSCIQVAEFRKVTYSSPMASTSVVAPLEKPPHPPRRALESRDPRAGEVWRVWAPTSADEVRLAVAAARAAQPQWAAVGLDERRRLLRSVRRILYVRRADLAEIVSKEVGKSAGEALGTEVLLALEHARWLAGAGAQLLKPDKHRSRSWAFARKVMTVERVPLGVIAVISPWNYPLMLAASPVLSALLAGNCIVLKPSEYSAATGMALVDALHAAGVPRSVVQCVPGDAVTGEALVTAGVDKVFFTGSTAGGRAVASAAGRQMTPVSLELGGADSALVMADADLELAARAILWGRLANAGQSCTAPKRVFVVREVYERFLSVLESEARTWRRGHGVAADLGPLIRESQTAVLDAQLHDARERGARIRAEIPLSEPSASGDTLPTAAIVTDVTAEMRISQEETFGPLLSVTPVGSLDEAVTAANHSPYGLSASVWTRSAALGRRIAAQLQVGTVMINDVLVNAGIADLAHGGVKASGTGRSHGPEGLLECTTTRTIVHDTFPFLPQLWWRLAANAQWPVYDAATTVLHGRGIGTRARAAVQLLRSVQWRRDDNSTP